MSILHISSSAIIMIILISFIIIIHEIGHFIAAKAVGIRVDKFGFGLPILEGIYKTLSDFIEGKTKFKMPKIPFAISKKIGETEYLLHAFVAGGYVSFPDDEEDCDLPKDSPKRFSNKTIGQRALVIVMGVIFNIIFAYFLIFMVGLVWKQLPDNTYTVKFEQTADIASENVKNAGFQKGDIIYSINGTKIDYPQAITKYFSLSKEFDGFVDENTVNNNLEKLKTLNNNISENETIKTGTIIKLPDFEDEKSVHLSNDNILGLEKYQNNEISLSDTQKKLRDEINYNKSYTTTKEVTLKDIAYAISDTKKPVSIIILRNNEQIELPLLYPNKDGLLGIQQTFEPNYMKTENLIQLTKATFDYANSTLGLMVYSLSKLFTGKVQISDMNGIIAITKIGTEIIANNGIFQGLLLTAMISLNLAIINILPIPLLDGGHLLFLAIEKIMGKPVKPEIIEFLSYVFLTLLLALTFYICYNDIHLWAIGKI